jgi:hypothetical protein
MDVELHVRIRLDPSAIAAVAVLIKALTGWWR